MKRKLLAVLSLMLVSVMLLGVLASCGDNNVETTPGGEDTSVTTNGGDIVTPTREEVTFDPNKSYIYKDSVSLLATNWNPHTYQTTDDAYPADFIRVGLYGFVFNDALHPSTVEGMEEYAGYSIIPEMASAFPVDITTEMKAYQNNKYGIPESADSGYAYKIALNKNAVWEDGTPINADTYVYSLEQLLRSDLANYRATDYYDGSFSIAGAEGFANSGLTKMVSNSADGEKMIYNVADLVADADGILTTKDGYKMYIGLTTGYKWMGGDSLEDYSDYFADIYAVLAEKADEDGFVPATQENLDKLYEFTGSDLWGNEPTEQLGYYLSYRKDYPTVTFDSVGIIKNDDYTITIVLSKSLKDFYLLYNLTSNWIVHKDLYEANLSQDANGVWSSKYNTSVETTLSYGPYKFKEYKLDQSMTFVKNDKWYGYTDGQHKYVDPEDDKIYPMYQTTEITCLWVKEAAARKEMFLKGQLMGYGLQSEDFEEYRSSDRTYFTPSETIFFFIFNGHKEAIKTREANEGFDKTKFDLETMTLTSFRKAVAITYDKEALCAAVSPARSGGYGIIGNNYIYDPETGAKYRDTPQAMKALCDFYSVDVSKFESLEKAVDSITGYDPVTAKKLYTQAFEESLAAGYITSADGKTCDQQIVIEYASSAPSAFITKTLDYLNAKLSEVLVGTPFEGKVSFKESAPLGNEWSTNIRNGMSDTVLGGWSGSALDPYGLTDLYVNPDNAYDAAWFDATSISMEKEINGEKITMTLMEWSDALNGTVVTVDGKDYNFGYGFADTETRLDILAALEVQFLNTYDYIPMLQDAGASLLTKQVYYVVEEYSSVMGRGGITYMKYNYDEASWQKYVADQGGTLKY